MKKTFEIAYFRVAWVTFYNLQLSFLFADTMASFKRYEQLSEHVKMYPCLYKKQEKDFKKVLSFLQWKFFLAKSVFLAFCFLPDAFYIDVEPKLMMPEAVNDVCMPSICFRERICFSKFGDNITLVGMIWWYKFIGRCKNIVLKMWLSPGNKSGDSFNFYLQNSIAWWEPSFRETFRYKGYSVI